MTLAELKAVEISARLKTSKLEGVAGEAITFDPLTISILISIIYNAIRLYQACGFNPASAATSLNKQSWLIQLQMRRLVTKECRGQPHESRRQLRAELERELTASCRTLTSLEASALYTEASAALAT